MQFLTQIFDSKIDRYLSPKQPINPKVSPDQLIKILKSKTQLKHLKNNLSTKTTNIFRLFKRLTIISLLLIYSNKFYDIVSQLPIVLSGNKWIDEEFVTPYYMFLKKLAVSNELYQCTKKQCPMPLGRNMELVCYNIGLMRMLFRIVNKMPLLGRYYKSKNEQILSMFINTIAVHAQKIYISFRQILSHMIQNPSVHIPTRGDEIVMKSILRDQLAWINEQMKKLFLDKYFYPLGKGIGIKLFRPQQQPGQSSRTIEGIMNDHQQTNREKQKNELQTTLFPEPGKINMKFYQQSLLSHMKIDLGDFDNGKFDEVVVELDDLEVDSQIEGEGNSIKGQRSIKKNFNQNDIETGIERYGQQTVNGL